MPPSWQVEIDAFPEYYAGYLGKYKDQVSPMTTMVCTGPVTYQGHAQLQTDIANLRAALAGHDVVEAFLPSTSPSGFGRNEYYAELRRVPRRRGRGAARGVPGDRRRGVPAAGRRPVADRVPVGEPGARRPSERRRDAEQHVEVLNHALRGIPAEKIRLHTCYGLNHGPRVHDLAFRDVAPLMLKINAGAYSFEVANPRHQHEWKIWRRRPAARRQGPHPGSARPRQQLRRAPRADRRQASSCTPAIVGRENVIAGADCGFSSRASFHPEVHPTVVWEKFRALAEGARLASRRLWVSGADRAAHDVSLRPQRRARAIAMTPG